ncbi:AAA family ATPase [Marisediminicola sp. LYQ134]|uniref:AAA family ATPase n=1 Tax=Marisediminicola sp. LYQ134 TaxID=3391061 RepID=UPI003983AFC3
MSAAEGHASAVEVILGRDAAQHSHVEGLSGRPPVVLIDGRSGAGKSTLAEALVARWRDSRVVDLIRLDDIYPGWSGLRAASEHVTEHVLEPHARGVDGRWRRWDWKADTAAEWHGVDAGSALVVEGCGVASAANRALATTTVWVELDEPERRRRALERDGDTFAPHWSAWARDEARFIALESPQTSADLVIDGRTIAP